MDNLTRIIKMIKPLDKEAMAKGKAGHIDQAAGQPGQARRTEHPTGWYSGQGDTSNKAQSHYRYGW